MNFTQLKAALVVLPILAIGCAAPTEPELVEGAEAELGASARPAPHVIPGTETTTTVTVDELNFLTTGGPSLSIWWRAIPTDVPFLVNVPVAAGSVLGIDASQVAPAKSEFLANLSRAIRDGESARFEAGKNLTADQWPVKSGLWAALRNIGTFTTMEEFEAGAPIGLRVGGPFEVEITSRYELAFVWLTGSHEGGGAWGRCSQAIVQNVSARLRSVPANVPATLKDIKFDFKIEGGYGPPRVDGQQHATMGPVAGEHTTECNRLQADFVERVGN